VTIHYTDRDVRWCKWCGKGPVMDQQEHCQEAPSFGELRATHPRYLQAEKLYWERVWPAGLIQLEMLMEGQ
jgi:hypothetical protein